MTDLDPASTLKRPPAKLLQRFSISQIGDDTIQAYLEKGFSLAICCRNCARLAEWTPLLLQERFGYRLALRIADIAERLSCTGPGGCGSDDVAVFPHLYDQPWSWSALTASDARCKPPIS
jgi:hypothetical protein